MIKERGGEILACLFPAGSPGVPGKGVREPVVVAGGEKEKIFGRGYGKNTEMGLFLSREIPAITRNGEPGKGARFEIRVPPGVKEKD